MQIITIGGGGGHAQILKGLKRIPDLIITAICPSTDSGGSTGILSRDYGSLGYLGDLTKCIAALCPNDDLARGLLYRFEGGCLDGHSGKNILLLSLERANGINCGLELMYQVCEIAPHRVVPVTIEPAKLWAKLRIGNHIEGETQIDNIAQNPLWHPDYHAIQSIHLNPDVSASPVALDALNRADWCIICPGDLYSSILPVLIPKGIKETLSKNRTKVVIILNIMTKKGETDRYQSMDFVIQIEKYLGYPANIILCNNAELNKDLLLNYAIEQKIQVVVPEFYYDPRIRVAPLVTITNQKQIYHDPQKVAEELEKIFLTG